MIERIANDQTNNFLTETKILNINHGFEIIEIIFPQTFGCPIPMTKL